MNLDTIKLTTSSCVTDTSNEKQASSQFIEDSVIDNMIKGKRDNIVESRSYGMVHVLSEMMNKIGLSQKKLFGSDEQGTKRIFDFLPCFLSIVLDPESTPRSSLKRIQSSSFFPDNMPINASSIRELIEALLHYPPIQDLCDYDFSEGVELSIDQPFASSHNTEQLQQQLLNKIRAWIKSEDNNWSVGVHLDGLIRLVTIASHIQKVIELETAMSWDTIYDYMYNLNAVKIEHGARNIKVATRPTSKQLMIFRRLGISNSGSVIDSENFSFNESIGEEIGINNDSSSQLKQLFELNSLLFQQA